MSIDWSKAPDWADRVVSGILTTENYWANEKRRMKFSANLNLANDVHIVDSWPVVSTRPAAIWNGEGLPPVGTVCDRRTHAEAQGGRYEEVRIIAYTSKGFPVWENTDGMFSGISKTQRMGEYPEFRQIRTPEQIAAEEREKAVSEMVYGGCGCDQSDGTTTAFVICGLLYDAGYRKVTL